MLRHAGAMFLVGWSSPLLVSQDINRSKSSYEKVGVPSLEFEACTAVSELGRQLGGRRYECQPSIAQSCCCLARHIPTFPSLNRLCCGGAGRTAEVVSHGASSMHVEKRVRESTQLSRTTCIHTNREESMQLQLAGPARTDFIWESLLSTLLGLSFRQMCRSRHGYVHCMTRHETPLRTNIKSSDAHTRLIFYRSTTVVHVRP
jgi:hypothetical protein